MLKPTIHKTKDRRGRINGYQAIFGPIVGSSSVSAADATADCENHVTATLARLDRGASIGVLFDHVWIVVPTTYGYAYWIDTFSSGRIFGGYSFNDAGEDRDKAIDRAIHHLAQSLWNAETDDHDLLSALPRTIRGELASWIGFQRSYIRIKAAGEITAENEIHAAACNMGHLYAREHFAAHLAR